MERLEEALTNNKELRESSLKEKEEVDARVVELERALAVEKKALGEERSKAEELARMLAVERAAYPDLYGAAIELNLKHVKGMLLYGPPGSGKTLIARSICKFLNAKEPLIVNGPDVLDAFQGAKSDLHVIIFGEIDSIAKKKGSTMGLHHMDDRLVSQLLAMIDGPRALNNIFIIGTTNRKELIDEALLREGKIELHVKVECLDEQWRLQILGIYTRNMRQHFVLDKDVNLHEIACRMDGCSGSALASLVTRAHSYAVVHTVENGLLQHVKNDFKVTMNHFLHAIEDVRSRLQESYLEPRSFLVSSGRLRMGKEEMFNTEVLHMQQEIARLKGCTAHFQATVETKLVLGRSPCPTLREAYALVQQEESRRSAMVHSSIHDRSALVVAPPPRAPRPSPVQFESQGTLVDRDRLKCDYRGTDRHDREHCWKLNGRPTRRRGCGSTIRPQTHLSEIAVSPSSEPSTLS
ncbi:vesicular-fusion protein sec18-like [Camellia sinensis]|uniref:vesicular-fusion protein sec18-like n=1 Tax=Camellia sinensis TaxID=4442 RepID=UPI00103597FB|nr:vesicular-fusion protein sec18-like [Camellia sinensis]